VVAYKPQGAFYITVRLPIKDCDHFVLWMLTEFNLDGETVMVAPASGFYATPGKGLNEVRMAHVIEVEKIKRGLVILPRRTGQVQDPLSLMTWQGQGRVKDALASFISPPAAGAIEGRGIHLLRKIKKALRLS